MKNNHPHHIHLGAAALYTAMLCTICIICTICTGCGNISHTTGDASPVSSDADGNPADIHSSADTQNPAFIPSGAGSSAPAGSAADSSFSGISSAPAPVDTNAFEPMLLRELSLDLTTDQVEDTISVYLSGLPGDVLAYAEALVSQKARGVQVTVTDGATGETLYDRTFSVDHIGEGQLSLVTDQNNTFLLETVCREQMGYASYTGEVFGWRNGEKVTMDAFEAHFLNDVDAVARSFLNGEPLTIRDEVLHAFRDGVETWSRDSELLAACDCMNNAHRLQSVFISTEKKTYTLDDFYSLIWDRPSASYTVEEFEELMGYSGCCIYETTTPIYTTAYYYSQEGQRIAEVGLTAQSETFLVDIDQDGSTELISNVMWMTGGQEVLIYRRQGGVIESGCADDLLDVEYDNLHPNCEYARYIPKENMVEIFYWIDADESFHSKKYEIDLEKIDFYRYAP